MLTGDPHTFFPSPSHIHTFTLGNVIMRSETSLNSISQEMFEDSWRARELALLNAVNQQNAVMVRDLLQKGVGPNVRGHALVCVFMSIKECVCACVIECKGVCVRVSKLCEYEEVRMSVCNKIVCVWCVCVCLCI